MRKTMSDGSLNDLEQDKFEIEISDLDSPGKETKFITSFLPPMPFARHISEASDIRPLPRRRRWYIGMLLLTLLVLFATLFPTLTSFLSKSTTSYTSSLTSNISQYRYPYIVAIDSDIVYVVFPNGVLHALRTSNGIQIWQAQTSLTTNYIAVSQGLIFITSGKQGLQVLRASDGKLLWQHTTSMNVRVSFLGQRNSTIFYLIDQTVFARRANDGTQLWQHRLSLPGNQIHGELLSSGRLFIDASSDEGYNTSTSLMMLNAQDGSEIWRSTDPGFSLIDGRVFPLSPNGLIYEGKIDGTIKALHLSDGTTAWQHQLTRQFTVTTTTSDNGITTTITIYDDGFFSGLSTALISDGILYISTHASSIEALDAVTGRLLWQRDMPSQINGSWMQVIDNILYLPTIDGTLSAIDSKNGTQLWTRPRLFFDTSHNADYANADIASLSPGIVTIQAHIAHTALETSSLLALQGRTGAIIWKQVVDQQRQPSSQMTQNTIYLTLRHGWPGAIRITDGYVLWLIPHAASILGVWDDIVYMALDSGALNAYQASNGRLLWSNTLK